MRPQRERIRRNSALVTTCFRLLLHTCPPSSKQTRTQTGLDVHRGLAMRGRSRLPGLTHRIQPAPFIMRRRQPAHDHAPHYRARTRSLFMPPASSHASRPHMPGPRPLGMVAPALTRAARLRAPPERASLRSPCPTQARAPSSALAGVRAQAACGGCSSVAAARASFRAQPLPYPRPSIQLSPGRRASAGPRAAAAPARRPPERASGRSPYPTHALASGSAQEGVRAQARVRRQLQRGGRQADVGADARHQLGQPAEAQLRAHVPRQHHGQAPAIEVARKAVQQVRLNRNGRAGRIHGRPPPDVDDRLVHGAVGGGRAVGRVQTRPPAVKP